MTDDTAAAPDWLLRQLIAEIEALRGEVAELRERVARLEAAVERRNNLLRWMLTIYVVTLSFVAAALGFSFKP